MVLDFYLLACCKLQDRVVDNYGNAQGTVIIPVLFVLNSLFGLTGVIWSLLIAETVCAF